MSNNSGLICKITNIRPHPNGDNILLGTASGYQVVVGLSTKEDTLGIYFPTDTCLGRHFSEANTDLLTYFGNNRRVRTQKFRGERSEGFWCPISTLDFTNMTFTEGQEIEKVGDYDICYKYINPATLMRRTQNTGISKKLRSGSLPTFQKHLETSHLRKNIKEINSQYQNCNWVWTYKLHGTSQRVGNVLVPIDFNVFTQSSNVIVQILKKSLRTIKFPVSKNFGSKLTNLSELLDKRITGLRKKLGLQTHRYEYLIGFRNVIIGEVKSDLSIGKDQFYSDEFRKKATQPFIGNLHRGEVVYYEVVGYAAPTTPIMGTITVKDKELKKLYSNQVVYSYGCVSGQCDIYVYRIAYQTIDGESIDLTWDQVKRRCDELGVKYVPEVTKINDWFNSKTKVLDLEQVEWIANWIEQPDPVDSSHPLEGVVLRIDSSKPEFYKEKSFTFKVLEGIAKDSDSIDLEDAS